jgi:hypothetical protein
MYPTQRPHFVEAVAAAGACLITATSVVVPGVQQRVGEVLGGGNVVHLTSSLTPVGDDNWVADALTGAGTLLNPGDLSGAVAGEVPELGGLLSGAAGMADADPIGDLWEQAQQFFSSILAGGFAVLFFGGIYLVSLVQGAWVWIADQFGFDPYPAEALATAVPGLDDLGVIGPVGAEDLTAALGGWTPDLDSGEIPSLDTLFDPTGTPDIDTVPSSLLPDIGI